MRPDESYRSTSHSRFVFVPICWQASNFFMCCGTVQAQGNVHAKQAFPALVADAFQGTGQTMISVGNLFFSPRSCGNRATVVPARVRGQPHGPAVEGINSLIDR